MFAVVVKVSNGAKIRNRYNQVPHLTQSQHRLGYIVNREKMCPQMQIYCHAHTHFSASDATASSVSSAEVTTEIMAVVKIILSHSNLY